MDHIYCNDEEILDLVDYNDNVIGAMHRSEVYAQNVHNFRVINAFLVNERGELWVPRRTANKKLFPLHLDASVGGHVSSGETYDQAFKREMQEEVGLSLDMLQHECLGKLTPDAHGVSAFMHVYKFLYNQVPPYNRNDFTEYYWFKPKDLVQHIKGGHKAKGDLLPVLEHFLHVL